MARNSPDAAPADSANGAGQFFSARGKLLISGEYLVAHGGLALALPVKFGQRLSVYAANPGEGPELEWESRREDGSSWMSARLSLRDFSLLSCSAVDVNEQPDQKAAERLVQLLGLCRQSQPGFLAAAPGIRALTECDFPRNWGLGTSSTLVSLLAQWSGADPFALQKAVFGGSGYDVACATASGPILYKLVNGQPRWESVAFNPPFSAQLYFVHLGKKQDSRFSLAAFESRGINPAPWLNTLVHLTMQLRFAETLSDFSEHLRKHEEVIAALTGFSPVQALHFADFPGTVKSLGAWGGDFVLAASSLPEPELRHYFATRGFSTVLAWRDMV
jgi:mevalonate kinase